MKDQTDPALKDTTGEMSSIISCTQRDRSKAVVEMEQESTNTHATVNSDSEDGIDLDKVVARQHKLDQQQVKQSALQTNIAEDIETNTESKPIPVGAEISSIRDRSLVKTNNSGQDEGTPDSAANDMKMRSPKHAAGSRSSQLLLSPTQSDASECSKNLAGPPRRKANETHQDFINRQKLIIEQIRGNSQSVEEAEVKENEIKNLNEITEEDSDIDSTATQNSRYNESGLLIVNNYANITNLKLPEELSEQIQTQKSYLSTKQTAEVIQILNEQGELEENIVKGFSMVITRRQMWTLRDQGWLSDEIVNFYLEMLEERSRALKNYPSILALSTFFYPNLIKKGYARIKKLVKLDISTRNIVLIPIHSGGDHWSLAVISFKEKRLQYYNSLKDSSPVCFIALENYMNEESKNKGGQGYDYTKWQRDVVKGVPEQLNKND